MSAMLLRFCVSLVLLIVAHVALSSEITLPEAYERAVDNDTRLQIARHQKNAIDARADQATALMYPSLRLFSQYSKNQVEYQSVNIEDRRYDGLRYGAAISQRVFDYSALSQIRGAGARSDGAELTLKDETQLLAVRLAEAYFNVLSAQGQFRALTDELTALEEQVEQTNALADRQLLSITERLEVSARRDLVETQQIDAENGLALAEEVLFAFIGERDLVPMGLAQEFVPFEIRDPLEPMLAQVMADNPRIRALEADLEAARSTIDQAWGSVLPKIDLVATRQYSDVGFDNTTSPPRDTGYVGLNVNWTLVEGGAARARAREAWANFYSVEEQLKQARQEIDRELRSAVLELAASGKRVRATQRALESAQASFEAATRAQKLGVGRVVDVLISRSALTRAKVGITEATVDNALAWIRLAYVKGELDGTTLDTVQARL